MSLKRLYLKLRLMGGKTMSKIYKTWEIWRDADKLKNREFNCINGFDKTFNEPVTLRDFVFAPGLGTKTNDYTYTIIKNLTGFEKWELIPQPVDFITAANSGKEIRPDYEEYEYDSLGSWFYSLTGMNDQEVLKLLNGKWLIREE